MKWVSILLCLLLLSSVMTFSLKIACVRAEPRTWTVDDEGPADFHTIHEAIYAANDGDTVFVFSGEYQDYPPERHLLVDKSITLLGQDRRRTIINSKPDSGDSAGFPLLIWSNNVIIQNLTFIASGDFMGFADNDRGVVDIMGNNVIFRDCIFSFSPAFSGQGIYVHLGSSFFGLTNCEVTSTVPPNLSFMYGLVLDGHNLKLEGNTISNFTLPFIIGGQFEAVQNGIFYHNNFVDNLWKPWVYNADNTTWNISYPSGGNYWSDYTGFDLYYGPSQNIAGSDGIGDTQYIIDANNIDHYPLMNPWTPTETSVGVRGTDYPVTIVSNTTLDQIVTTPNTLHFKSSGLSGDKGYINVIFPMVNTTDIKVFIDGKKLIPSPFPVINSNGTHYFIYFEFPLSTHDIGIQFAPLAPPVPVGGEWVSISKLSLLAPWISSVALMAVLTISFVCARRKRRAQLLTK